MKCPYCQADNQEGHFCRKCGKPLAEKEAQNAADALGKDEISDETQTLAPLASDAIDVAIADFDEANGAISGRFFARYRRVLTILALVIGILLAAVAAVSLFTRLFDTSPPQDPAATVKEAEIVAPDTGLAEDTIVGYWRHYNTGSVIEKIGSKRYRWTIDADVYRLDFKDNQYIYKDENGSTYAFVLVNSDRLVLNESHDASGGLISKPIFEAGFVAGRVGQDGTMTKSMQVNAEAFDIVGKTYAQLAGTYGPGALSVIGDNQYIIFRGDGGNFAVQFTGATVPLSGDIKITKPEDLASAEAAYEVVPLTNTNPAENPGEDPSGSPEPTIPGTIEPENPIQPSDGEDDEEKEKEKEFKLEIPDMPSFPSNTAVAIGVVWADLGFVIHNAPASLTVEDLSAVLGIALEVGASPGSASGFVFYGMDEGYFAGTYGINNKSFYISGYGASNLNPDKTIIFIQQVA